MRFKKISTLFGPINWRFKPFSNQQPDPQNIYRIVDVKQPTTGKLKILIQIIGKATIIACTPQEIVSNDRMIEGFSKKDIRTITYFACQRKEKPRYRIVMQEFCEKFNRIIFKIKNQNTDETIIKNASQISLDENMINDLSKEDIKTISYTAGYEHSQNEKNEINSMKNQH